MSASGVDVASLTAEQKRALLAKLLKQERAQFPLSFAQQRLWFLEQLTPGNPFYSEAATLRFNIDLDPAAFGRALNEIVRRHDALRTTFEAADSGPVQVVSPSLTLEVPIIDLTGLNESQREVRAEQLAAAESRRAFDLTTGPLIRTTLLKLDREDWVFLLAMHHIICDGWSLTVFLNELSTIYACFSRGEPSPLPELPVQYADFAVWQRKWLQSEVLDQQLNYWRERLRGLSTLQLPTDYPRPTIQSHRGASVPLEFPPSLHDELRDLGRRHGATLFMTVLAGFVALLHRYTGQEDIVVGSPIANRNRSEIEGLIGFFVNSLVLRTDVSGNPHVSGTPRTRP